MPKKKLITISVTLEPELYQKFEELSENTHRSMAGMLRFIMEREITVYEQLKESYPKNDKSEKSR